MCKSILPIFIFVIMLLYDHYIYEIKLNWTELNWTELNWTELNWTELNWTELNWTELNWTEREKNYIAKASIKEALRYFSETVSSSLLVIQLTVIFHESWAWIVCLRWVAIFPDHSGGAVSFIVALKAWR